MNPSQSDDIFSISDENLSNSYKFIQEIGFGNWGSVWLCESRHPIPSNDPDFLREDNDDPRLAVKIVHRNKTATTSARVRSLWNEMKIVRSFKHDPHPSIIPFYNFIITPSYALITMKYLPRLVPVEVPETKAREWCRSLVSAIDFLHKRGIVHNDIKPANIMLTGDSPAVPVLVDFGFAERYDTGSKKAFISNLAYGTPEYLSPERARGMPHDTRKSDVWSLGITLFEVLVGRTPFEYEEGETFATKEDLERYWTRTLKGKWLGEWKFSPQFEKLLKRMLSPNADLRCTARQALADSYFHNTRIAPPDAESSLAYANDAGDFMEMSLPWASPSSVSGGFSKAVKVKAATLSKANIKSRLSTFATKVVSPTGPRIATDDGPSIRPMSMNKENDISQPKSISRKPVPQLLPRDLTAPSNDTQDPQRTRKALGDVTNVRTKTMTSQSELKSKKSRTKSVPKIEALPEVPSDLSMVPESPVFTPHYTKTTSPMQTERKDKRRSIHEVFNLHRRAPSSPALEEMSPPPGHTKSKKSWKDLSAIINASKSSLPAVQQAARNVQMATENRLDRMTIWIKSVEETVEGARRNLETGHSAKLPVLPPMPGAAPKGRAQRKVMAVNQIFRGSNQGSTARSSPPREFMTRPDEVKGRESRINTPVPSSTDTAVDEDDTTRPSFSVGMVTALDQTSPPESLPEEELTITRKPLPTVSYLPPELVDDDQYERIILNTSCVKRVGMGYQSNIGGPVESPPVKKRRSGLFFNTMRRQTSGPAQENLHRRTGSVDELGLMNTPDQRRVSEEEDIDEPQGAKGIMQRAVRAVLGATHSRRKSRAF